MKISCLYHWDGTWSKKSKFGSRDTCTVPYITPRNRYTQMIDTCQITTADKNKQDCPNADKGIINEGFPEKQIFRQVMNFLGNCLLNVSGPCQRLGSRIAWSSAAIVNPRTLKTPLQTCLSFSFSPHIWI